ALARQVDARLHRDDHPDLEEVVDVRGEAGASVVDGESERMAESVGEPALPRGRIDHALRRLVDLLTGDPRTKHVERLFLGGLDTLVDGLHLVVARPVVERAGDVAGVPPVPGAEV